MPISANGTSNSPKAVTIHHGDRLDEAVVDLVDDYNKVIYYTNKALKINKKEKTYINEVFSYNSTAYDLRSIAYYYLGKYKASLKNIKKAITMEPNNERFISNKKIIEDKLK